MTYTERYILGFDEFHPCFFARPAVHTIRVLKKEGDVYEPQIIMKLTPDGRISEYDHMPLGWIAYPQGHAPTLQVDRRTKIHHTEEGSIHSTTCMIAGGEVVQTVFYDVLGGRLLSDLTVRYQDRIASMISKRCYTYDGENRIIGIDYFMPPHQLVAQRAFERDAAGRIIQQVHHSHIDRKPISMQTGIIVAYQYDRYGLLAESVTMRAKQRIATKRFFYADEAASLFSKWIRTSEDEPDSETFFEYDAARFLVRRWTHRGGHVTEREYQYESDT